MKLVIFDLDEVLMKKGNNFLLNNRLSFAVNKVFGVKTSTGMFSTFGMTDTSIMIELARRVGISRATTMKHMKALYKVEIKYSRENIKESSVTLYKGVVPLLKRLKKNGYIMCLATGNLQPVARLKLKKLGINSYFKFGGFGTSLKRVDLIRDAMRQAESRYGKFDSADISYFGDSPLDVKGGKEAGVNIVAVAQGKYTMRELAKEKPDYLLKDLADTKKVLKIIKE